jgi:histone deacetylase 1/2
MVGSSAVSSIDWFINCGCTTQISGGQSMLITYTNYPPNAKKVNGYNGVTLFASRYGSIRLICQLPDGKTKTIILQEVLHLPVPFNLISQSQIMDKYVKDEPVNHYCLNLYNRHGKLIARAPQVDRFVVVDRALDQQLTEYTDIDDSFPRALRTTGHASQHNGEKRMSWHRRLPPIGLKALVLLPTITNASKMTRKCDCESCIKCKSVQKLFAPTTSRATDPLHLVHSDICGALETAIGGGRYMLLFIQDATRSTDEHILKNRLEALEKLKEWKALREKDSGKQVKQFRTDGGCEYSSKKFAQYLKSEGILKEMTTTYSPQCNGFVERANRIILERI